MAESGDDDKGQATGGAEDGEGENGATSVVVSGCEEEEGAQTGSDWEVAELELPSFPAVVSRSSQPCPAVKAATKQRGRGVFTYGERGMYSDYVEGVRSLELSDDGSEEGPSTSDQWENRGDHVLVVKGCSSKLRQKDLEQVVKSVGGEGVAVRFIRDTTALAVFRSPAMARKALASIQESRFKVHLYRDEEDLHADISEKDLKPPVPRPPTSVRSAQRMIAGALSAQGVGRCIRAKGKLDTSEAHKQESERRQRLQTRQQLRDDAWGDD